MRVKRKTDCDRFTELVNTYPDRNEAYQALVALVNAEVPVYEFQRGLVDYYAKQYDAAIAAFERFIAANEDHGNAHYYIGLVVQGRGQHRRGVEGVRRDHRRSIPKPRAGAMRGSRKRTRRPWAAMSMAR